MQICLLRNRRRRRRRRARLINCGTDGLSQRTFCAPSSSSLRARSSSSLPSSAAVGNRVRVAVAVAVAVGIIVTSVAIVGSHLFGLLGAILKISCWWVNFSLMRFARPPLSDRWASVTICTVSRRSRSLPVALATLACSRTPSCCYVPLPLPLLWQIILARQMSIRTALIELFVRHCRTARCANYI